MSIFRLAILSVFVWACSVGLLQAQIEYNMSNQTVTECEGILFDSNLGDNGEDYNHNENLTFSICIGGNSDITMDFLNFCTEEEFDYLRLFDGPDTLSTQIGMTYSGEDDPPRAIATSGCLTINFISDANVACSGWEARWFAESSTPVPPEMLPIDRVPCLNNTVIVEFSESIICDSLYAGNFEIRGPQLPNVVSTRPINCVGGKTNQVELTLDPAITRSGNYSVTYTYRVYNECKRLFTFRLKENFVVNDCPISVVLEMEDDALCAGTCTFLFADASGGDSRLYGYNWAPAATDSAYAEVCPTVETTYFVTVTDAVGATAETSITITPSPAPTIEGGDRLICQSVEPFTLVATTPNGRWSGMGIDEENEETGFYEPDLVLVSVDSVFYIDENDCETVIAIEVIPLNDGNDDASCPDADPFFVSGGFPAGGVWSGEHITEDGLFSPIEKGSFPVTYTHPNGCQGTKSINVDSIQMPTLDTLCQSEEEFKIPVTPFGGEWTGNGIDDPDEGLFVPEEAEAGSNLLYYEINGCLDSMVINIREIRGGKDISACPEQAPFILPGNWGPAGGYWIGNGIIDSLTGEYDPSLVMDGENDTLTFITNGCIDNRIVYIRQTEIGDKDTLNFCLDDNAFRLNEETVEISPRDGVWNGAGIVNPNGNEEDYFFNPSIAGEGVHTLYYEANTCLDSFVVIVSPRPVVEDYELCVLDAPIVLEAAPKGNVWRGKGIINREDGVFDPSVADVGTHRIINDNRGCRGEAEVVVVTDEEASIQNVVPNYCFQDTVIIIEATPEGGMFMINDIPVPLNASGLGNTFNPSELGSGEHLLKYAVGIGDCYSEDSIKIEIGESFQVTLPAEQDTICFGESTRVTVDIESADPNKVFTYIWDTELGFGRSHLVNPISTTNYTVAVTDGCQEISKSVEVFVHPEIQVEFLTGEAVCFEDTTSASVIATPGENYDHEWSTDPPTLENTIFSYPTFYEVKSTNLETGCEVINEMQIPGYGLIKANFAYSPNVDCISDLDPTVEILDFSVGAERGFWDFGDGSARQPYRFGEDLSHTYADTGQYTIRLFIENEGNCTSEHEVNVCIKRDQRLFAPNAFSPNYDGYNDFFQLKGIGISDINWKIFNRWGQVVFNGNSMDDKWDGRFNGQRVLPGVYTFMVRYKTADRKDEVLKGAVAVVY